MVLLLPPLIRCATQAIAHKQPIFSACLYDTVYRKSAIPTTRRLRRSTRFYTALNLSFALNMFKQNVCCFILFLFIIYSMSLFLFHLVFFFLSTIDYRYCYHNDQMTLNQLTYLGYIQKLINIIYVGYVHFKYRHTTSQTLGYIIHRTFKQDGYVL